MQEFEQTVKTAYWIVLGVMVLIIIARFFYFKRTKSQRISIRKIKPTDIIIIGAIFIIIPIFFFYLTFYIFVLQKVNLLASSWMKNTFLVLISILVITEIYYNFSIVPNNVNRVLNILFVIIAGSLSVILNNLYFAAKKHPSIENSVIIDLPFKGEWIAAGAGASSLTNHHNRIASQKYAVDISRIGSNGKLFTGSGIEKEESNTYGAEVYSPVNGEVVYIIDNLPDSPTKKRDELGGNHIVIQFQDSLFVALAHLQPNSIPPQIGDQVSVGDLVGKVGMSGNTDFCHLHIHIQDRPKYDIDNGKAYPIRFRKFKRKRFALWLEFENQYLLSNDIVKK